MPLRGGLSLRGAQSPSGVPQGTKLGPWLFVVMINDLEINGSCVWKYVDDTTASEVVGMGKVSSAQIIADKVAEWSLANRVQLNNEKCKELRISFGRNKATFEPIRVHGKELELVDSAKLLGITVTSDLSWNNHVNVVTKKLYFLVQLKRVKVPCNDSGLV